MTAATHADQSQLGEWLRAVAGGDAGAFEQLYRSTSSKLFGVCIAVLTSRSDAEEVLQEVFTTIWRKASQYDATRASPMTWLAMMARNRAIDKLRASAAERSGGPIELAEDIPDPAPTALAGAQAGEDKRRLDSCMDQLEPQRRKLIRVAFFEGITYEELAQRSGSPLGSVKSWIRRGLAQLKTCLER